MGLARFIAKDPYQVEDGNDIVAIDAAIRTAQAETERPSFIGECMRFWKRRIARNPKRSECGWQTIRY